MNIDLITIALSLSLIQLPRLFEGSIEGVGNYFILFLFWLVIINNLFLKFQDSTKFIIGIPKIAIKDNLQFSFICYLIIFFTSVFRAYSNGIFQSLDINYFFVLKILTLFLLGFSVFSKYRKYHEYLKLQLSICYALWIYVGINVLLFLMGIQPSENKLKSLFGAMESAGLVESISPLGIEINRVVFPIADGIGSFGNIAGLSLVSAVVAFQCKKSYRPDNIALTGIVIVSLFAVILTDTKGAIGAVIFTTFILNVFRNSLLRVIPFLLCSILFLEPFFLSILSYSSISGLDFLSRGGSSSGLFSGRENIWLAGLNQLSSFSISHLFGFGIYGQVSSGVSYAYSSISNARYMAAETTSLHNFVLQTIFDTGYIGLGCFILLLYLTLKKLITFSELNENNASQIMIALLIYYVLAGATEIIPAVYHQEAFFICNLIFISTLFLKINDDI